MKRITGGIAALFGIFVLIQLVPYGRDHQNPPVVNEPTWDAPRTRTLFFDTCKDCHSNETVWPWYSSIAPVSWLVYSDVEEGRAKFNVSRWGQGKQEGDEAAGMIREGEMPPWFYLPAHSEAWLDDAETQELIDGLIATFGDKHDHEQPAEGS